MVRRLTKPRGAIMLVLCVMGCAFFSATAAGHYLETRFLEPTRPAAEPLLPSAEAKVEKVYDADALLSRQMFCSTCQEQEAMPMSPLLEGIQATALPLSLLATHLSDDTGASFATLKHAQDDRQGGFSEGEAFFGLGVIRDVRSAYVDFENSETKRLERLWLITPLASAPKTANAPSKAAQGNASNIPGGFENEIKKTDESSFDVKRTWVESILENPASMMKGLRAIPNKDGLRLYAIRKTSPLHHLGIKNGDLLTRINGFELNTPDKAMSAYMKLQQANALSLEISRRGRVQTLSYNIK